MAGVTGLLGAIVMPLLFWSGYADVKTLHRAGKEDVLTIGSQVGEKRGHKGTIIRFYAVTMGEMSVRIRTTEVMKVGSKYPVIFATRNGERGASPEFWVEHTDYLIGTKSETAWQIFNRNGSPAFLWLLGIFEGVLVVGSLWALIAGTSAQPVVTPRVVLPNEKKSDREAAEASRPVI